MKQLLLLRHAKSGWGDASAGDHARTLNDRGRRAAAEAGDVLNQRGLLPDLILVSNAVRTAETLAHLQPGLGHDAPVRFEPGLYLAPANSILGFIRGLPDQAGRVLIIGHNPGLGEVAASLAATGPAGARARLRTKFPTAALAVFSFKNRHWKDAAAGKGHLDLYWTPREGFGCGEDSA